MSRRVSLPGAEELFRPTRAEKAEKPQVRESTSRQEPRSTTLQVATPDASPKTPRHDEKVTFYCTTDDLTALEQARLKLRAEYGIGADRGRIVRAALDYVLEDFEARGDDSVLLRRLS